MGCDISGGVAKVYKLQIGSDASAVLLFTSASATPFDFVFSNNTCYFGNGTEMRKYDGTTLSNWGIVAPAAPGLTLVAGTANVFASWCYCSTYYNSNTGHESSPSPISACTGVFTSKNVRISVTASADAQVTNIRIYRTPDGGAQDPTQMQEISGSPFANTTTTHDDNTPDTSLSIRVAPAFFRNDPPPLSRGFVTYAGRIWSFSGNTTSYSGFEEIANGVPEECWPSGLDGNTTPWANEVMAHGVLSDGIAVLQAERISKIEGDSLDTFRRYTLLERRGTRSQTSVVSLGGSVGWLDSSGTAWISDLGEVGLPIRPDLAPINPANCWSTVHISGIYHWWVILDGTNGVLYVFDLDLQQWMPPWKLGVQCSALLSGEDALANFDLLIARNRTKVLKLVSNTYNDDGNNYLAIGVTSQYPMTPGGSPIAGTTGNVAWRGVLDWTEIKTDTNPPSKVEQLTDDDPTQASPPFADITPNKEATPDITQGVALQAYRYTSNSPTCQLLSLRFTWPAIESNFHLYTLDVAYHPVGT